MYIILFKKEIKRRATSSAGQSTSFTPRGSAVRIRSRLPHFKSKQNQNPPSFLGGFFYQIKNFISFFLKKTIVSIGKIKTIVHDKTDIK